MLMAELKLAFGFYNFQAFPKLIYKWPKAPGWENALLMHHVEHPSLVVTRFPRVSFSSPTGTSSCKWTKATISLPVLQLWSWMLFPPSLFYDYAFQGCSFPPVVL